MIDVEKYIDIKTKGVDMIINQTGGSAPVIETLNVTPSTSAQTITAPQGTDGYNPVNVSAVTSSIDANITAGNIKSGVTILGTTGNVVELNGETTSVTPTTSQQIITPTSPHNGLTSVTVDAVTSSIDANITAGNIKSGVSILGVSGSVTELNGSTTTINPSTSEQIVSPTSPSNGFTSVTVPAVTASIDANIQAGNIKDGVTILGTTGTYTGGSAPAYYIEKTKDSNNKLVNGSTVIDLTGITDVGAYVLNRQYYYVAFPSNTNISFSSLTTLSGDSAMNYCFASCTGLTSVSFPSLTTISGNGAMQNCFSGCTSLTSLSFPALTSTSFGSYTSQFNTMLQSVTGCTVHFPSNLQSIIGSWASVTSGFGGTNTTILYDLPATNTLVCADTKSYERNPKYDTATALAWYEVGTDRFTTQYYTSGLTDPTVGTTIYSDSACTTPVTTVSSIS